MGRAAAISRLAATCGAAFAVAIAPTAAAHQSNPNFDSTVRGVEPPVAGLAARVLGGDDQVEIVNRTRRGVLVPGYGGEPYIRITSTGVVAVNMNSPSHYLNQDRYGAVKIPGAASDDAQPRWERVSGTGRYAWHDHRIHWMSRSLPPQVGDREQATKIQDWTVPLLVGGRRVAVQGELYWRPRVEPGPTAPLAALGVVVLVGLIVAGVVLRRRRATS